MEVRQTLGGRYKLLSELGSGGMAVVWRAHDEVLGRPVAVKLLAGRFAADPRSRERIRDEARAAANLSHPNIAQVYDYGEAMESGIPHPYVVMELVNGPTLQQRVSSGPLPPRTIFRICGEVAAALAAAHAEDLVHRDIKMANIMVTPGGAKVVDFGIAAAVGPAAPEEFLVGTPAYLAPERLTGDAVVPASDVYALGVLLYRLLADESPWSVESTTQMLKAHVYLEPAPLPDLPGVPHAVIDLVARCLRKDPAARPTANQVSGILGDALEASIEVRRVAPDNPPRSTRPAAEDVGAETGPLARPNFFEPQVLTLPSGEAPGSNHDRDNHPDGSGPGPGVPGRRTDATAAEVVGGAGYAGGAGIAQPAGLTEHDGGAGTTVDELGRIAGTPRNAGPDVSPAEVALGSGNERGLHATNGAATPGNAGRSLGVTGAVNPGEARNAGHEAVRGVGAQEPNSARPGHASSNPAQPDSARSDTVRSDTARSDTTQLNVVPTMAAGVVAAPRREVGGGRRAAAGPRGVPLEKRKALLAGGGLAAVAVVALLVWFLTGDGGAEDQKATGAAILSIAPTVTGLRGSPTASRTAGAPVPAATEMPGRGRNTGSGPVPSAASARAPVVSATAPRRSSPTPSKPAPETPAPEEPPGKRLTSPGGAVYAVCESGRSALTGWETAAGFEVERFEPGPALTTLAVFAGDRAVYRMTVTCVAGSPTQVVLPL